MLATCPSKRCSSRLTLFKTGMEDDLPPLDLECDEFHSRAILVWKNLNYWYADNGAISTAPHHEKVGGKVMWRREHLEQSEVEAVTSLSLFPRLLLLLVIAHSLCQPQRVVRQLVLLPFCVVEADLAIMLLLRRRRVVRVVRNSSGNAFWCG